MKKYASGSRSIDKDQLAIVNEEGPELIYSPTLKTFIAPLREGDMVFDNESSERLWKLGQGIMPPDITQNMGLPQVPPNVNNNNNSVNIHYDSVVKVNGNVNDAKYLNELAKSASKDSIMEAVQQAEKTRKYGMF